MSDKTDPRAPLLLGSLLIATLLAGSASCATGGPAAAPRPSAGGPIVAGAAVRTFTPEVGADHPYVSIAGFGQGRAATGVHDDLCARALVLEAGGSSVALVALDLIGFFHDDVVAIRAEVRARHPEVGVESILVASTHTHAGPDVIGLWMPPGRSVDPGLVARIRTAAADAVAEAWRARRPAALSFASAQLPRLIQDSRLPQVIDATALLMKVDTRDGRETIATLLEFPSHPESLGRDNTLISSDYPWAARRRLEREFGGIALFFSGDIGGLLTPLGGDMIDPETGETLVPKTPRATEAYGEAVARGVIAAWRSEHPEGAAGLAVADAGLEVASRPVKIPLKNPRFVQGLSTGQIWHRELAEDGTLTSEVAVLTIVGGPEGRPAAAAPGAASDRAGRASPLAQFACVPGEIYPELVLGGVQDPQDPGADIQGAPRERPLRPMMSGPRRFVLGLCNDELGYIIPRSQWDLEPPYAYGRTGPQYGEGNSTGPDTAPTVIDAFAGILLERSAGRHR